MQRQQTRVRALLLGACLFGAACGSGTEEVPPPDTGPSADAGETDMGIEPDTGNTNNVVSPTGLLLLETGFVTSGPTLGAGGSVTLIHQGFETNAFSCNGALCVAGGLNP